MLNMRGDYCLSFPNISFRHHTTVCNRCRRMLNLGEETDIDRITGAATWSMPPSPTSSEDDSAAAEGAGWRVRHGQAAASRDIRRSNSMGPMMAPAGGGEAIMNYLADYVQIIRKSVGSPVIDGCIINFRLAQVPASLPIPY